MWAVAETVCAIVLYWYVFLYFETSIILYTSIFLAPIFLLRTEYSIHLGVRLFSSGLLPVRWQESIKNKTISIIMLSIIVSSLIFIYFEMKQSSPYMDISTGLIIVIMISISITPIVYFIKFICVGPYNSVERENIVVLSVLFGIVVVSCVYFVEYYNASSTNYVNNLFSSIGLIWVILWSIIVNLYSVVVRFIATARFVLSGIEALPINIARLARSTAPMHVPELVPGLQPENSFRFSNVLFGASSAIAHGTVAERVLGVAKFLVLPVWFLPSWAYRFILKSTLWLWWILFFIGGKPKVAGGLNALAADDAKRWNKAMVSAAMVYIGLFVLLNLGPASLRGHLGDSPVLPVAQVLFVVWDIGAVPWVQLAALGSALLTLALWFLASDIKQDQLVEGRAERVTRKLDWFARLARLKVGLSLLSLTLLLLYLALMVNKAWQFLPPSEYARQMLELTYGTYAKALYFGF